MAKPKAKPKPKPTPQPKAQPAAKPTPTPTPKAVAVGDWVEVCQVRNGAKEWLPMLVTHVHGDDVIGGVAFSGAPAAIGWGNRGAEPFSHVQKGTENRQWRPKKA